MIRFTLAGAPRLGALWAGIAACRPRRPWRSHWAEQKEGEMFSQVDRTGKTLAPQDTERELGPVSLGTLSIRERVILTISARFLITIVCIHRNAWDLPVYLGENDVTAVATFFSLKTDSWRYKHLFQCEKQFHLLIFSPFSVTFFASAYPCLQKKKQHTLFLSTAQVA